MYPGTGSRAFRPVPLGTENLRTALTNGAIAAFQLAITVRPSEQPLLPALRQPLPGYEPA